MNLLRKCWALWGVLLFLVMMFLSLPVIGLNMIATPGERALRKNIWFLHHVFTAVFLGLVGIRIRTKGKERIDGQRSYVIVSNHNSSLDFIVNASAFPGVFRFLAKKELQKIPVFGWVVKKMCLTVDRSSAMSRARSVVELKKQLEKGWSIFIYPEGGRNRSGDPLGTFFDGAFRLAIQTKAPIAVQTVVNIRDVSATARSADLRPGIVRVEWDEPIPTEHLTSEDIPQLKETVRQRMLQHLNR